MPIEVYIGFFIAPATYMDTSGARPKNPYPFGSSIHRNSQKVLPGLYYIYFPHALFEQDPKSQLLFGQEYTPRMPVTPYWSYHILFLHHFSSLFLSYPSHSRGYLAE